jgi:hypothetical protein
VPTYRIYYAERELNEPDLGSFLDRLRRLGHYEVEAYSQTDWEEKVEARNKEEALETFFRDHVRSADDVMEVDHRGRPQPLRQLHPDGTYLWIEEGKLMEYQGMEEATPGMVDCPLCEGSGEVPEETAEEFLRAFTEGEEEATWG